MELIFVSPIKGEIIPLSEVPDEAFSKSKFGCGFAIIPDGENIVAPTDGTIMCTFDTNHAIAIRASNGVEYLIHIGIDTYKLKGKNFKCLVSPEQRIKKGDLLLEFDLNFIKSNNLPTTTPIVFTNIDDEHITIINNGDVEQGEEIFCIKSPNYIRRRDSHYE